MNNEDFLLLFNVFWLSFTFSLIVCVYYDNKPTIEYKKPKSP